MFTDEDVQYIAKAGKFDDYLKKSTDWAKLNPAPTGGAEYAKWKLDQKAWDADYLKSIPKETLATITTSFCDKAKGLLK